MEFVSVSTYTYSNEKGHFTNGAELCVRLLRLSETFHLASDTFFWADYKWSKIHLFLTAETTESFWRWNTNVGERGEYTRNCTHYFTCVFSSPKRKIETFQSAAYFEDKYCQLFAHASDESQQMFRVFNADKVDFLVQTKIIKIDS